MARRERLERRGRRAAERYGGGGGVMAVGGRQTHRRINLRLSDDAVCAKLAREGARVDHAAREERVRSVHPWVPCLAADRPRARGACGVPSIRLISSHHTTGLAVAYACYGMSVCNRAPARCPVKKAVQGGRVGSNRAPVAVSRCSGRSSTRPRENRHRSATCE